MKPKRDQEINNNRIAGADRERLTPIASYSGKPIFYYAGDLGGVASANLTKLPKHSTWAFFLHGSPWTRTELQAAVGRALDAGAAVFMFHGSRSEEAHDVADQAIWGAPRYKASLTDASVVLTTWHDDALSNMAFEVLQVGLPADAYEWSAYCVITIGSDSENKQVRALFKHPQKSVKAPIWK